MNDDPQIDDGLHTTGLMQMVRELVFGTEDGLVSILGLVTGVAAGSNNPAVVLLAGVAGALSGAVSMAAGNYLGAKSQKEVFEHQLKEEQKRIQEQPEKERRELEQFYRGRGFTEAETQVVVEATERNKGFLLEEMVAHELGIGRGEMLNPTWKALWIFISYLIAAAFPVTPYALFSHDTAMVISISATTLALFAVGAWKTVFTRRNSILSGLEMLLIAALAGVVGYLAGHFVVSTI